MRGSRDPIVGCANVQPFRFHEELKHLSEEPLLVRIGMYLLFGVVVCPFVAGPIGLMVQMAFHPLEAPNPLTFWLLGLPFMLALLGIGLWVSHHAMVELSDVRQPSKVLKILVATLFVVMILANLFGVETLMLAVAFFGWIPMALAAMVLTQYGRKIHQMIDLVRGKRNRE